MQQIKNITQYQLLICLLILRIEFTITDEGNVFVDNKPLHENKDIVSKIRQRNLKQICTSPENIALVEIIMKFLACCKRLIYHNSKYISVIMPSTKECEEMKFGIYIISDGIYVERKENSCIGGTFLGLFKWTTSQVYCNEIVQNVL